MSSLFAIPLPARPGCLPAARTASVINAGDGMHEHPSQALLDMLTILDNKKNLAA